MNRIAGWAAAACIAALVSFPGQPAGAAGPGSRIHPALRDARLARVPPDRSPFDLRRLPGGRLVRVHTLDPAALRRAAAGLGLTVRAVVGDVASVEAPDASLPALAGLAGVVSVKPARSYRLDNDISTAEVGADDAAADYGGTGRGAIVAVIDTGLDFHHRDFRNADGTTRVLAAWDQTDASGGGAGCPPGVTFGRCWSRADLDADLAGGAAAGLTDGHGHGTHVAGTAAGNGLDTAGAVPAGTYAGVAPGADLLIVKVFTAAGLFAGDLTAAYAWIRDQAAAAGEPFAINMSLGSDFGPHDGTDPDEMSLDALLAPGAPGRAAAIAAGNSRGTGIHAEGDASAGAGVTQPFLIPVYTPAAGTDNDIVLFDLWYAGGDDLTVGVVDPNGVPLAAAARGATTGLVCTASGGIVVDATNAPDPDNLDNEVVITIADDGACPAPVPPPSGASMAILVTAPSSQSLPQGGHYHIWTDGGLGAGSKARFSPAVESTLVGIPGTSRMATTAGAYITRNCWPNADPNTGTTCFSTPPIGTISNFSSNGPTRDGRQKPEISAPGDRVVSSLSADRPPPSPLFVSPDGRHWALRGTSMASPHVAGALAVVLQLDPGLDAAQARGMIIDGARADGFTGAVPNALYGYGKLGVLGGAQAVLKPIDDLTAALPDVFSWTAEPHSATYNVYQGALPGDFPSSYGACFLSGLTAPSFADPRTPLPGGGFTYLVTGVKDGVEGSLGFDSAGALEPNALRCP